MATDGRSRLLVVDDDEAVGKVLTALLAQAGFEALFVNRGEQALVLLDQKPVDLVITDVRMPGLGGLELLEAVLERQPGLPVVLLTAHATVAMAVEAMKLGACDFLSKPFDREEILFVVKKALEGTRAEREAPPSSTPQPAALDALIGASAPMDEVRQLIRKAASTSATVLIRGETGTGKELVARALHALSARSQSPFVRLNCGALPDSLLESELFGYEKGAFTGAAQRKPGRVELAQGGTLFLDEIGDVSPAMQVRLLRLLQEKEFERLGGTETLKADLRFIAATHQPLEELVKRGDFRADLLYRLNVVPITLPPLRARPGDLPVLIRHFHARHVAQHGRPVSISDDAVTLLAQQRWPGNVRQVQNLLERLVVLADGDRIDGEQVQRELDREQALAEPSGEGGGGGATLVEQRQDREREAVLEALQKAAGSRTVAARLLGVSRRTLYNKLEALGIAD